MATIRDIANLTGLSTATISRHMNNKPYVSKEAQRAIERAVTRLDYRPNAAAQSLKSGKTGRVVVVLDRVDHSFYGPLLAGLGDIARRHSYELLVQQSGAPQWSPHLVVEQARARSMDGIITTVDSTEPEALLSLVGAIPIVACDQALFGADCPHVYIDHYKSTIEGLEHLHERGAKTIAGVYGYDPSCGSNRFRRKAYADFGMRDRAPVIHQIAGEDDEVTDGAALLDRIMALSPRPDAIFTGGDEVALGLLAAANKAGISVPSELAILGFDDRPIAEVFGISTIRQPVRRMGQYAMATLLRLIAAGDRAPAPKTTVVKHRLVVRSTT